MVTDSVSVIPFPQHKTAAFRRLQKSLAELVEENIAQAKAVEGLSQQIGHLGDNVQALKQACEDYQEASLRLDIAPLRAKARRLAAIMS